jgi:hypothetical protein
LAEEVQTNVTAQECDPQRDDSCGSDPAIGGSAGRWQAHTDTTVLSDVADRPAAVLPADADEIEELLSDQRWALLGVVPRLVKPFGNGVQWNPADHRCAAGELLAADSDHNCAIRGEIVKLSRWYTSGFGEMAEHVLLTQPTTLCAASLARLVQDRTRAGNHAAQDFRSFDSRKSHKIYSPGPANRNGSSAAMSKAGAGVGA